MIKKAIWFGACLLVCNLSAIAQCNHRLVEIAANEAGADAIYIREYKVKLSKGTMDEPSPTGKFPVFLNKGVQYRFTVANAREYEGQAIVEVTRRGQQYAGNYNFNNYTYSSSFDFLCDRSSTYQILINYGAGKEGCSAIVMSMVMQDSMVFIDPALPVKSDSAESLYLWIENNLQIASSKGSGASLDVSISQGSIEKRAGVYIAKPDHEGEAIIHVVVKRGDEIVESDSVLYFVKRPPLPRIFLPGEIAGGISKNELMHQTQVSQEIGLNLSKNPYKLLKFGIVTEHNRLNEYISNEASLSIEQISQIRKLEPGEKIYIVNPEFLAPDGKIYKGSVKELIVRD